MKREVKSLEELRAVAESVVKDILQKPASGRAVVVGLVGELGAGKTAFTKCVASVLGIEDTITSPTFILEKVYTIPRESVAAGRFAKLIHIDAYRLQGEQDMRALGWGDIVSDEKNLIIVEWPEIIGGALPEDAQKISFEYLNETTRVVTTD